MTHLGEIVRQFPDEILQGRRGERIQIAPDMVIGLLGPDILIRIFVVQVIVILCIGTLCYLAIIQAPVPQILVDICLIVVSFFFGSKTATAEAVIRSQLKGE